MANRSRYLIVTAVYSSFCPLNNKPLSKQHVLLHRTCIVAEGNGHWPICRSIFSWIAYLIADCLLWTYWLWRHSRQEPQMTTLIVDRLDSVLSSMSRLFGYLNGLPIFWPLSIVKCYCCSDILTALYELSLLKTTAITWIDGNMCVDYIHVIFPYSVSFSQLPF